MRLAELWITLITTRIWYSGGCLYMKVNGVYKGDIHRRPYWQLYVSDGITQRWYKLPSFRLLKIVPVDLEDSRRIFRRTMRPYAKVQTLMGHTLECISFPWVDDFGVRINVREPGQPGTMRTVSCERLRPVKYYPRRTGVPADDPLEG